MPALNRRTILAAAFAGFVTTTLHRSYRSAAVFVKGICQMIANLHVGKRNV
jgi:hypothetical protein